MLDAEGEVILSRKVEATEEALEAVLLGRGERVRYVPGTAVNKAREAHAGGEQKSDPKDAFVIAEQLRLRWKSLSEIRLREEDVAELRVYFGGA